MAEVESAKMNALDEAAEKAVGCWKDAEKRVVELRACTRITT